MCEGPQDSARETWIKRELQDARFVASYDDTNGIGYVYLTPPGDRPQVVRVANIEAEVIIDRDAEGHILGVEFILDYEYPLVPDRKEEER